MSMALQMGRITALVGYSNGLYQLMRRLPSGMWRMPSLVRLLELRYSGRPGLYVLSFVLRFFSVRRVKT
jgi:hypothetical protein